MAIESTGGGGTLITGERDMHLFRLLALKQALGLEIKTDGRMKLTRGPKATTLLRREYGITGNRETQMLKLLRMIEQYEAKRLESPEEEVASLREFPNVGGGWGGK